MMCIFFEILYFLFVSSFRNSFNIITGERGGGEFISNVVVVLGNGL